MCRSTILSNAEVNVDQPALMTPMVRWQSMAEWISTLQLLRHPSRNLNRSAGEVRLQQGDRVRDRFAVRGQWLRLDVKDDVIELSTSDEEGERRVEEQR